MYHECNCLFCGKQVIGLTGQDMTIDLVIFSDQEESPWLKSASHISGDGHIRCLCTSEYGGLWAKSLSQLHMSNYRLDLVFADENTLCFRHQRIDFCFIVKSDGFSVTVAGKPDGEVRGNHIFRRNEDCYFDFQQNVELKHQVRSQVLNGFKVPLRSLIDGLGLQDNFYDISALDDGYVKMPEESAGSGFSCDIPNDPDTLWLGVHYKVFIPAKIPLSVFRWVGQDVL